MRTCCGTSRYPSSPRTTRSFRRSEDQGVLTAAEARSHPRRSIVTQAVQGLEYEPTLTAVPLHPGDRVLLCSDGLSDFVADEAIGRAMRSDPDPNACAKRLVRLALDVGAPDNVTVVVADVATAP